MSSKCDDIVSCSRFPWTLRWREIINEDVVGRKDVGLKLFYTQYICSNLCIILEREFHSLGSGVEKDRPKTTTGGEHLQLIVGVVLGGDFSLALYCPKGTFLKDFPPVS